MIAGSFPPRIAVGGRLAIQDAGTISVASNALVLTGIIAGLPGYAAGNWLWFGLAYLVRTFGFGLSFRC